MEKEYMRKEFGRNIARIRTQKNISLEQLSADTKISVKYLKRIEKGEALRVKLSHLFALKKGLKTTTKDLLTFS